MRLPIKSTLTCILLGLAACGVGPANPENSPSTLISKQYDFVVDSTTHRSVQVFLEPLISNPPTSKGFLLIQIRVCLDSTITNPPDNTHNPTFKMYFTSQQNFIYYAFDVVTYSPGCNGDADYKNLAKTWVPMPDEGALGNSWWLEFAVFDVPGNLPFQVLAKLDVLEYSPY